MYIKRKKVAIYNIVIVVNVIDVGVREELKKIRTMMNKMKIKEEETKKKYDHLLTITDRLENREVETKNSTTNR